MIAIVRFALYGVVVLIVQWLVLGRLEVFGAAPDAVLLYVAWFGLQFGRRWGSVAGFVAGVAMDAIYDTWGIHMLLKTLLGFVVGLFSSEDREILVVLPRQALVGGLVVAVIHNGLLVAMLALQAGAANPSMLGTIWIGAAAYTAFVAFVAAWFARR